MPKATRIIQWRNRRHHRHQQGGRTTKRLLVGFLFGLIFGAILLLTTTVYATTLFYATITQELPPFPQQQIIPTIPRATKIYAQGPTGEPILIDEITDPLGNERQWLTLDQLPSTLVDATITSEDPTFWQNSGLNFAAINRALFYTAETTPITIDQQVVQNNLIPANNDTNIAEILLLTHRLNDTYTKEQILEWHLNSNYYGNLAYGIEAAAHVYFNKTVIDLTLAEVAMLAAIPPDPSHNPIATPTEAKRRQEKLLDEMVQANLITRETAASAQFTPLTIIGNNQNRFDIIAPHFAHYVRQELAHRFTPQQLLYDGLTVYTSLDLEMQQQAECLTRAHLNRLTGTIGITLPADELAGCTALTFLPPLPEQAIGIDHNTNNAALIALNPQTGEIKAMVGSLNYWDNNINGSLNIAVDSPRQPAATFNPFIYLTALSQGYTAATMILDIETNVGTAENPLIPQNADGRFRGPLRLRQALANSYHVPAVQVTSWVGTDAVIRTAQSLGLTTLEPNQDITNLAIYNHVTVTLLDMVYAYAVIDNMGVMIGQSRPVDPQRPNNRTLDPVAILRVEDANGQQLYDYTQPQQREILTAELAYLINDILADRNARCDNFGCPNPLELPNNRLAAVKTGSGQSDNWTLGYTPQLVSGVWVGNSNDNDLNNLAALHGAAPIWHAFMSWALQDQPVARWPRSERLIEIEVCNLSGLLPTPNCPTISEQFIEGTQPTVYDTIYQEVAINRETNRLATIYTPPELIERQLFRIYPEQAAQWVNDNNIPQPPTEYDTVNLPRADENLAILSPPPFAIINDSLTITGTAQIDNFAYYRLAYFQGLTPNDLQTIVDDTETPINNASLGTWDVSNLDGLYTILLTAVRQDGSFVETSTHITVDNIPPTAAITFPLANQQLTLDQNWVTVQAQVTDNVAIQRVDFYLDGRVDPFASRTAPPFSQHWPIVDRGCHTFTIIATDTAGNQTPSAPVPFCITVSN